MCCIFLFLHNSLSIWSLDFLNLLETSSLVFVFSKISPSNHFLVFVDRFGLTRCNIVNNCSCFLKEVWICLIYVIKYVVICETDFHQGIFVNINSVLFKRAKSYMFVNTPCYDFINISCIIDKLMVRYTNINDMLWNLRDNIS